jgi:hypothetical protein
MTCFRFQVKTCVARCSASPSRSPGSRSCCSSPCCSFGSTGSRCRKPRGRIPIGLLFADHAKLASTALAPYLEYLPRIEWSWLANRRHLRDARRGGVACRQGAHRRRRRALLGVPLLHGRRQVRSAADARAPGRAALSRADRLRRLDQYRRGAERLEPAFDERPEARLEQVSARAEARNDRVAFRKEPFIGADEVPAGSGVELPSRIRTSSCPSREAPCRVAAGQPRSSPRSTTKPIGCNRSKRCRRSATPGRTTPKVDKSREWIGNSP